MIGGSVAVAMSAGAFATLLEAGMVACPYASTVEGRSGIGVSCHGPSTTDQRQRLVQSSCEFLQGAAFPQVQPLGLMVSTGTSHLHLRRLELSTGPFRNLRGNAQETHKFGS